MTDERCLCGREYVQLKIKDEGVPVMGCPRFPRSWRNLWIGGLTHDARANTPDDYDGIPMSLVWQ